MSFLGTTNLTPQVSVQELLKVPCRPVLALLMRAGYLFYFRFTELCSRSQGSLVWSGAKMPIIYTVTGIGNRQRQRRIWPRLGSASHVGSALQMYILTPVKPSNEELQSKRYGNYSNSKQYRKWKRICRSSQIATKLFTVAHNIFGVFTSPSHKVVCIILTLRKPSRCVTL